MEPKKILVVLLVLVVGICFVNVAIKIPESSESSELIDAAVDILISCYGDRGPIGLVGKLPRTFLSKLWSKKLIPVILFDPSKRILLNDDFNTKSAKTKLNIFLFITTTRTQASTDIAAIYNFRWYNPLASILAISVLPKMEDRCTQVVDIMDVFVNCQILYLNMLCIDANKKMSIYGYNPHVNQAPHPWRFVGKYKSGEVSLFLFKKRYLEGNEICNNLDYDKTKDLGGKVIIMYNILENDTFARINFTRLDTLDMRYITYSHLWEIYLLTQINLLNHTVSCVHLTMNATCSMVPFSRNRRAPGIISTPLDTHVGFNLPRTMPLFQHHHVIVTKFRGDKLQLRKILTVIDMYSRYCVGLTLFVTLIFFKFITRQHFIPGMLNVIRMMCNTGFINLPANLSSRIYLTCLFVFIITIHGIFSGNLASLLTSPIPVPHPRTIQDLIDMNYTTYVDAAVSKFLMEPKYEGRFLRKRHDIYCPGLALRNTSIACIDSKDYLTRFAAKLKLYVSSNDILTTYRVIKRSFRYPYIDRTTEIFLKMTEARILEPLYVKVREIRLNEIQYYNAMEPNPPRVMNLDDLAFAFVILGIGLGCAILSFIIEIAINPVRSRIAKVRRYFRH